MLERNEGTQGRAGRGGLEKRDFQVGWGRGNGGGEEGRLEGGRAM
jgi:hypothetical protein